MGESSIYKLLASTDLFSKEVMGHLVKAFFDISSQYCNLFNPVNFLRQYVQGTDNTDLLLHCLCGRRQDLRPPGDCQNAALPNFFSLNRNKNK